MEKEFEIRTDENILIGYRVMWADGGRGIGIFQKDHMIGAMKTDYILDRINDGPCMLIEEQYNR